jgi:hypothetical protein
VLVGTSGNGEERRALIAEWAAQMDAQLGLELVQVRLRNALVTPCLGYHGAVKACAVSYSVLDTSG